MNEYLKTFKQTTWIRAAWLVIIAFSTAFAVLALFVQNFGMFVNEVFIALVSWWAYTLERELTQRNHPTEPPTE